MGMKRWRLARLVAPALMAALFFGVPAIARVEGDSGYSKAQTYSAALRYLRVDLGFEVLEKDPEAAYLVFRYLPPSAPKTPSTGTLEVVERPGGVRIFVRLPSVPEYHEVVLRDGLLRKLRDEYGAPPPRKPPTAPAPADAGTD
jgi:hypothetical protein